jgi:hypothetical protein
VVGSRKPAAICPVLGMVLRMSEAFRALLASVESRGFAPALLAPGRIEDIPDCPDQVAATYAVAGGMDEDVWSARFGHAQAQLLPNAVFFGVATSRAFAAMQRRLVAEVGEHARRYWSDDWWPLLSSQRDVVAVHGVTGEVWFAYPEGEVCEVIAPSLDVYWVGCARWVQNFTFDPTTGWWDPVEGYAGPPGPWDPRMTWQ